MEVKKGPGLRHRPWVSQGSCDTSPYLPWVCWPLNIAGLPSSQSRGEYISNFFFFFFTVFLWRLLDCSIPRALICSVTSSEGCSTQQKLSFPDSDTSKIKLRVTPNPVLFSPPGLAKERYSEEKYYPKQDSEMHMRHLEGATKRHCPHSLCFLMEYSKLLFLKAWDV